LTAKTSAGASTGPVVNQKDIAQKVLDKGGQYVLAVKANQGMLRISASRPRWAFKIEN
jgi:hypothetical protein